MASKQAVFLGMILLGVTTATVSAVSENIKEALTESQRTVIVDGGSTDSFSITDIFLYIGTLTLAALTALVILGLIYDKSDDATASAYETTGYTGYEQAYAVARSLYDGYNKYSSEPSGSLPSAMQ